MALHRTGPSLGRDRHSTGSAARKHAPLARIPAGVTNSGEVLTPEEDLRELLGTKGDDLGLMAINLTRDVMDAASNIPYVKGIAGVVGQLIRINQDLRTHKTRCKELLKKVLSRSKVVLEPLLRLKNYDGEGDLKGLCDQLEEYLLLLEDVASVIQEIQKRNFIQRVTNRALDELNELDRRITGYSENIIMSEVVQLRLHISQAVDTQNSTPRLNDSLNRYILPPPPVSGMKERDEQRNAIVKSLLDSPNVKFAILGMGGMGKTTLATEVMRQADIRKKYPTHYFVSFEGLTTIELVYTAFANALSIPAEERSSNVRSAIDRYLQQGDILLCCDNFETFWEPRESRTAAEEFLASISSFERLSVLVTLRGTQRPNRVRWTTPFLPPLEPLSLDGSEEIMSEIMGETPVDSESARKLLRAVEGLPLAVTLISNLLRDGNLTADALWDRWCSESTRVIENESPDRQSNLDISLELSINGPRMTNNPHAKLLLAALAILPDGLPDDPKYISSFQEYLPDDTDINVQSAVYTLRSTALVTIDKSTSTSRIRLLSPIRHFCLNRLPLDGEVIRALITLYTNDERMSDNIDSKAVYSWISREMVNIKSVLEFALCSGIVTYDVGRASEMYTWWSSYLGLQSDDIIKLAIDAFSDNPLSKGWCLNALGKLYRTLGRFNESIEHLTIAAEFHRVAGSKDGEANDLIELGICYRCLERDIEAISTLNRALELFQGLELPILEGAVLKELAFAYLYHNELDLAVSHAEKALALFQEHSHLGRQTDVHQSLGEIYRKRQEFERAKEQLTISLQLSEEIKYLLGQYNALRETGLLCEELGDVEQAILYYKRALTIAVKIQDESSISYVKGALDDLQSQLPPTDAENEFEVQEQ